MKEESSAPKNIGKKKGKDKKKNKNNKSKERRFSFRGPRGPLFYVRFQEIHRHHMHKERGLMTYLRSFLFPQIYTGKMASVCYTLDMRPIPPELKQDMSDDPYYKKCARANGDCEGRITWEHAWIYGGRQINEKWAIIPLCVYHHLGAGLNKAINQLIALTRATVEDLQKYPKKDWEYEKSYLEAKTNHGTRS